LRWKQSPAKGIPAVQPVISDGLSLAVSERRAIDYFNNRLWPRFSTVDKPCPPPIALALRSQPVLQALCVFAEEHRALQKTKNALSTKDISERRRLQCLTVIRSHLGNNNAATTSLPALLVAVLLLYFLEGYINCTQDGASTQCHLAGAVAIINALGGFEVAWSSSDTMTRMLLSELASTDLTDSMLQDRKPSFPINIWKQMDSGSVWWESLPGTKSLAAIFETMAEMCFYRHGILHGEEANNEKLLRFEHSLQPAYSMLEVCSDDVTELNTKHNPPNPAAMASLSLNRTFQHAGLIYLYRALRKIPTERFLVQQHVYACLETVQSMKSSPRSRNCTLFPLYVAGAHAIVDHHRDWVLEALNSIYFNLEFESALSVRATLQHMWHSSQDAATWSDLFKDTAICTLVI
jgi:hypothetical protein